MSGLVTEMMRCPAEHHATLINQYLLKFDSSFTTPAVRLPDSKTLPARSKYAVHVMLIVENKDIVMDSIIETHSLVEALT